MSLCAKGRRVVSLFIAAVVSGCADAYLPKLPYDTATPYQSANPRLDIWGPDVVHIDGGYAVSGLRGGMFRVRFLGNVYTTLETTRTYGLYRCAVLAEEQGFPGFEIVSASEGLESDVPSYTAQIRLLRPPFTLSPPKVFNAARLKAALDPHVMGMKCEKNNVCPHAHDYLNPR
jgi:hypothetical protein